MKHLFFFYLLTAILMACPEINSQKEMNAEGSNVLQSRYHKIEATQYDKMLAKGPRRVVLFESKRVRTYRCEFLA